jgi:glycosyltransferase involved in cell wall biosynthesis
MRVVINRLSASGPLSGVGHYTRELCQAADSCAGDNSWDLFPNSMLWPGVQATRTLLPLISQFRDRWSTGGGLGILRKVMQGVRTVGRPVSRLARGELHRYIQATLSPRHFDLYHEPNFIPLQCDLPTAITIHDLSVLLYPQWHPTARVARYERAFQAGLARSEFIFTSSEYVRFQVVNLLNVPSDRVRCLYPGVRANMRPLSDEVVDSGLRRLGLSRGYYLYVGTIEPRKNLHMLMKAYCSLPRSIRERRPLVLAGQWGWGIKKVANYYETVARHEGVRHLGYVSEATLPILYNGACSLVYPSHYEGFGLPPIEMLACGGKVLAADIATLTETLGDSAVFVAPGDTDGWRDALIQAAAPESSLPSSRDAAVQKASIYSWRATAQQAWEAYTQFLRPAASPSESAEPGRGSNAAA